jgi:hypothetical protein
MEPNIIAHDIPPFEASLALFFDRASQLARVIERSVVEFAEELESTQEFAEVLRTASALERTKATSRWLTGQDKIVVGTFLRRSGVYLSLHGGETISATDVGRHLRSSLLQSRLEVTYLAPIELVHFAKDQLSFDRFTIRQFSVEELAALTQNGTRALFYPWAKLDLDVLKSYWFLVATNTIEVRPLLDLSEILDSRVRPSYTGFPQTIERGLFPLVLCDWVEQFGAPKTGAQPPKRDDGDGPVFPHVPFVLTLIDHCLHTPESAPDIGTLAREAYFDQDGNEMGDHPSWAFYFDESETARFEEKLREFSERLSLIDQHQPEWRFVFTALRFLTKATRTQDLEQLLWHITAIEAVLGQKSEGLTSLLKRRVGEIFGGSESDKREIRKRFNALYEFRSDLVHGNAELDDRRIVQRHLAESRDLARGVVAWATGLLAHAARTHPDGSQPIPSREDFLLLLDMTAKTRASVGGVLPGLPPKFPVIEDWLG